jgi:hypothetical protein
MGRTGARRCFFLHGNIQTLARTQPWAVQEGGPDRTEEGWVLGWAPPRCPHTVSRLSGLTLAPLPPRDSEIQESRFLDQEDWGPHRTSEEMRHLQNDCVR